MPSPALSDDPNFLKDQVLRLSAELARAQGRHEASSPDGASASPDASTNPWMVNAEHLPPLLSAYDTRIAELERAEALQREKASLAESELKSLQQNSDRMRSELHHALEAAVRTEALASHTASASKANDPATRELHERLDILYKENEILCDQARETSEELERLREEKLAQARDHMSMVKQIAALRDELGNADVRARRAAESRDRARSELQQCAAELIQAQEHTQSAMSIAERHASERDAALASVAEHRTMLETLNGRASSDREALQADLAVSRASERDVRELAANLEAQLNQAADREQALMDRLSAELSDKKAGAEALSVLEGRCNESESRNEQLAHEPITAQLQEASNERTTAPQMGIARRRWARGRAVTSDRGGGAGAARGAAAQLRRRPSRSPRSRRRRTMEVTIADLTTSW